MAKIWNNLKTNQCPRCKCALVKVDDEVLECGRPACKFKILESELIEVLKKMNRPVGYKMFEHSEEENLSELNNL